MPAQSTVELVMWLAEERAESLKLVSGPRHEDGVPLLVYWLPRKLVRDLARVPGGSRSGAVWPKVIFSVPGWLVAQHNLGKFAVSNRLTPA
jgi:hypothetical protein